MANGMLCSKCMKSGDLEMMVCLLACQYVHMWRLQTWVLTVDPEPDPETFVSCSV